MNKNILMLLCLISLGLTSCSSKSKHVEEENISYVKEDDKEMNAAMNNARETFDQFEKAFLEKNNYSDFVIKEGFPTKDGSKEHMWVSQLFYNGKDFIGIVANDPVYDTEVQYGDTITVDRNLISDWMYTDTISNLTYGGYTMRVFVNRMSDTEKAAFLEDNGFEFAPIQ